jgi:hypothetical protein
LALELKNHIDDNIVQKMQTLEISTLTRSRSKKLGRFWLALFVLISPIAHLLGQVPTEDADFPKEWPPSDIYEVVAPMEEGWDQQGYVFDDGVEQAHRLILPASLYHVSFEKDRWYAIFRTLDYSNYGEEFSDGSILVEASERVRLQRGELAILRLDYTGPREAADELNTGQMQTVPSFHLRGLVANRMWHDSGGQTATADEANREGSE